MTDTTLLPLSGVRGMRVSRVFNLDTDDGIDCDAWVPDESKLFNFCIECPEGKQLWLFDNAGNRLAESSIWSRIFDIGWGRPTLGILLPSGGLHWAWFEEAYATPGASKSVRVNIENVEMDHQTVWLPTAYHSRIEELSSSKRPFSVSFQDHQFIDFIEREIGYQDLRYHFTIQLYFHRTILQLSEGEYRELSPWKSWK